MADSGLPDVLNSGLIPALDLGLCLEPTDSFLQVGCVGSSHIRVVFEGQRAHSARPWHGKSAISMAGPLIEYLGSRSPISSFVEGFEFRDVMTITQAKTLNSRNVVPDKFELNINHRFPPGVETASAVKSSLLELAPFVLGAQVSVLDSAPSGSVEANHPLLAEWRQSNGIEVQAKQAWTDVARLSERGIPAVNFGPGATSMAHQAREWVDIAALVEGYTALRDLLI